MRLLIAVFCVTLFATLVYAEENSILKTERERTSYSLGMSIGRDIGNSFKSQSIDIDHDILLRGMKDTLSGEKPLLTEKEFQETMEKFKNEMMAKQAQRMKELADKNKKDGEDFLADNKKKDGVVTLSSGLQYKVIKEGTGGNPKETDTVTVNYRGTLINGTEFDSSERHGRPATFQVNAVIPGWTEALQLMKAGSKWQLFIPSHLAYGDRSVGPDIGPNTTLIFEVELLSVGEGVENPHGN